MAKRGRKDKKQVILDNLEEIKRLSSMGYSEKEIANHIGMALSTFSKYKNELTELKETVTESRKKAIADLEKRAYELAYGYEYKEEKMIIQLDEDGNAVKRVKEIYTKHQPPNGAMQQFLLTNWTDGKYSRDPVNAKFREEELKLKKEMAEWKDKW